MSDKLIQVANRLADSLGEIIEDIENLSRLANSYKQELEKELGLGERNHEFPISRISLERDQGPP